MLNVKNKSKIKKSFPHHWNVLIQFEENVYHISENITNPTGCSAKITKTFQILSQQNFTILIRSEFLKNTRMMRESDEEEIKRQEHSHLPLLNQRQLSQKILKRFDRVLLFFVLLGVYTKYRQY
jgi:hypothetical protein